MTRVTLNRKNEIAELDARTPNQTRKKRSKDKWQQDDLVDQTARTNQRRHRRTERVKSSTITTIT